MKENNFQNSIPFSEYPRPQMKRDSFFNLNGTWKLNGKDILVPFPPESQASNFNGKINSDLEYTKEFVLPDDFRNQLFQNKSKKRLLLHFGAVDQIATIFVNDVFVGTHHGGYLPFYFDITDYLTENSAKQTIKVIAKDTLNHLFPYGKQKKNRGGMWYTPVSGIWQTVWMEIVPEIYISKLKIVPDTKGFDLFVETTNCKLLQKDEDFDFCVKISVKSKSGKIYEFESSKTDLRIDLRNQETKDEFELWSPDCPALYDFCVELFLSKESMNQKTNPIDCVSSYFALREIQIKKLDGINRICLNDKPIFLHGVLDQGYFPEGIYLPESSEGFKADILRMKELGINTLRKHIKIEPEIFYYECDKNGMLVMQDFVNNGSYNFLRDTAIPTILCKKGRKKHLKNCAPSSLRQKIFVEHSEQTVEHLFNHPSIIYYTIFNEGWGQFNANFMYKKFKELDSSRIWDTASGWFKNPLSDVESDHIYFKTPSLIERAKNCEKPLIISECGGYTLKIENHVWNPKAKYGYGSSNSKEELTQKILQMYKKMIIPAIKHGLCGCVYTQLSDVEDEINGFYTYDRKVCKVEKEAMQEIAEEIKRTLN